ncbi:MAG: tetratricopeptide repeat protein [Desulfobulbaceae bacterium]|jgi:predicted O-linked N-acetylglucosamine transferase (SPINDLY family)|nr:tetratricopeptide repeat protein [Desulfobulbaceae bacterium]
MKRRSPFSTARKPAVNTVNAADEAQYRRAVQCHEQGRHDEAFAICERLRSRPALEGRTCLLLGRIHLLRQEAEAAEAALRIAAQKLGSADAWFNLALALTLRNKPDQTENAYRQGLRLDPKQPRAWNNLGNLLRHGYGRERLQQAMDCYRRAIELQPDYAQAHLNLGLAYRHAGQEEEAERHYRKALEMAPNFIPALTTLAAHCHEQGRHDEASEICERLISPLRMTAEKLGSADAWCDLALSFMAANKPEQAQEAYRKGLEIDPKRPRAWNNLGNLLHHGHDRERLQQAVECYQRAIELRPDYAHAHVNLGFAYENTDQNEQAERHYRKALEMAPDAIPALTNLANLLEITKRSEEALPFYRKAWELAPGQIRQMAHFIGQRRKLADWSDTGGPQPAELIATIRKSGKSGAFPPFPLLAWPEASPDLLRDTAASYAYSEWGYELSLPPLVSKIADTRGRRIRIGYLSADFRNHPVTHLITDLISHHDREQFEVFLYAYGPEEEDEERRTLRRLAEHFMSVSALGDRAAAEQIRADGIDLLVDLTGHTTYTRLGITALRPAAVIVSWLGYIGSLGEPRLADYVIGDAVATPPERAGDFSESLALIPHCFQPNRALAAAMPLPDRQAENLPDDAFVFCSFNQCFKLTPALWDDWCRILSSVENSVLWLAPMLPTACDNLRREAARRGIDPNRLVFATKRSLAEHQARVPLADLALDTWPYNSGATASDVLRAGVPLVTLLGDTFAGRMGASLLHCLGLDELIAKDRPTYIDLAVALAADKARLHALKTALASRLPNSPLFDPRRFCRDLERLFQAMLEQRARGESGIVRV